MFVWTTTVYPGFAQAPPSPGTTQEASPDTPVYSMTDLARPYLNASLVTLLLPSVIAPPQALSDG